MDEVGELNLRNRDQPVQGGADGGADDGRFGEWRVENACLTEPGVETIRGAEHSALPTYVLAHDEDPVVALHLLTDGGAHRLDHPHLSHLSIVLRRRLL